MKSPIHPHPSRPRRRLDPPAVAAVFVLASFLALRDAAAQLAPADQFFNSGAQFYISNNIPAALERVEAGLKAYPDDRKLKQLEQLLKQQQQSQENSQDKKDQQQKKDQEQQERKQQKDGKDEDRQKQDQADPKKKEDQKDPRDPKKETDGKPPDEKKEGQPGQMAKPGEMTPEEAKKLLDAQKGREQLLQPRPDVKPRDPGRPIRDW